MKVKYGQGTVRVQFIMFNAIYVRTVLSSFLQILFNNFTHFFMCFPLISRKDYIPKEWLQFLDVKHVNSHSLLHKEKGAA